MFYFNLSATTLLRIVVTVAVWLMAALLMSACSVISKHPNQQSDGIQQIKTAAAPIETNGRSVAGDFHRRMFRSESSSVEQRKKHFFAFMKPIVRAENKTILQQRQNIMRLKTKTLLDIEEQNQLRYLTIQYQLPVSVHPSQALWQALLNRVDIIPLDLALAQAANESAWGRSRFAREGNNYFGQWCFRKGCGIIPAARPSGASHEVRRFRHAAESVHAYMKNINTSAAYRDLRKQRALLRKRNMPLDAEVLANELKNYSERGKTYVNSIRSMIRSNRDLVSQADLNTAIRAD